MNTQAVHIEALRTYRVRTLRRLKARNLWLKVLLFFAILRYYFVCIKHLRSFLFILLSRKFDKHTFPIFFGILPHRSPPINEKPNKFSIVFLIILFL